MLVPASRQDEVVALAVEAAKQYTVGDPSDEATRIGPMASEAHRQKVVGYIERGIADGARLRVRRRRTGRRVCTNGAYVQPTIFADVDPTSAIAQEEIFGPVLTIIPYADEEEAVAIANGTLYGLTSGVFGEPEHALAVAAAAARGPGRRQRRPLEPARAVRRLQAVRQRPRVRPLRPGGVPGDQVHPALTGLSVQHRSASACRER